MNVNVWDVTEPHPAPDPLRAARRPRAPRRSDRPPGCARAGTGGLMGQPMARDTTDAAPASSPSTTSGTPPTGSRGSRTARRCCAPGPSTSSSVPRSSSSARTSSGRRVQVPRRLQRGLPAVARAAARGVAAYSSGTTPRPSPWPPGARQHRGDRHARGRPAVQAGGHRRLRRRDRHLRPLHRRPGRDRRRPWPPSAGSR